MNVHLVYDFIHLRKLLNKIRRNYYKLVDLAQDDYSLSYDLGHSA